MKRQWMPMFWGDFLANTMNLSAQEVGAYMLLIAHAWEHGGMIPYDQAQRIARIDNRHWRRVRGTIEPFFEVERDAKGIPRRYYHGRVLSELAKADELSSKRKAAALHMHSKRRTHAYANHDANGMHKTGNYQVRDITSSFTTAARDAAAQKKAVGQGSKASEDLTENVRARGWVKND